MNVPGTATPTDLEKYLFDKCSAITMQERGMLVSITLPPNTTVAALSGALQTVELMLRSSSAFPYDEPGAGILARLPSKRADGLVYSRQREPRPTDVIDVIHVCLTTL